MTLELPRRGFLLGLGALIAAPAVVRASSLMPVRAFKQLTAQEYVDLIMKPMIDKLNQQIADSIIYGSPYQLNYDADLFGITRLTLNDLHSRQ